MPESVHREIWEYLRPVEIFCKLSRASRIMDDAITVSKVATRQHIHLKCWTKGMSTLYRVECLLRSVRWRECTHLKMDIARGFQFNGENRGKPFSSSLRSLHIEILSYGSHDILDAVLHSFSSVVDLVLIGRQRTTPKMLKMVATRLPQLQTLTLRKCKNGSFGLRGQDFQCFRELTSLHLSEVDHSLHIDCHEEALMGLPQSLKELRIHTKFGQSSAAYQLLRRQITRCQDAMPSVLIELRPRYW